MKHIFYNCTILDGSEDMQPQTDKVVVTKDDLIVAVESEQNVLDYYLDDDCVMHNLHGKYLLPGLINLHEHIPSTGEYPFHSVNLSTLIRQWTQNTFGRMQGMRVHERMLKLDLFSGLTTIRAVGGVGDFDTRLRDRVVKGRIPGPRVLAGNKAISVPGGHMAGTLAYVAHTPEEAARYVRLLDEERPDLIKLMVTGGVTDAKRRGEPGEMRMSPDILQAACDEAHRFGYPVAAHAESTEGVKEALRCGVDTIEHGARPDAEMIQLFKETGAAVVTTITPTLYYAKFDPKEHRIPEDAVYNGRIVFDGIVECAKACLANDIPVGLGTDTGSPYSTHYGFWRELMYFVKYCDVSNRFALYTGTLGNAKIAGIDGFTGSIETGKIADLIVVDENPLEDLETLRTIRMVVARGRVHEAPMIRRSYVTERELDRFIR